jgi:carboxypeptidase Taq
MSAYSTLKQMFHEIHQLHSAIEILNWDGASMMPSGGAEARAEQMATLGTMAHQKMTSHYMSDLLNEADIESLDNEWDTSNLQLMRHEWRHANAVSSELVEAISRAGSKCEHVWRGARAQNDWESYLPLQQEVLELARNVIRRLKRLACLNTTHCSINMMRGALVLKLTQCLMT